MPTYIVKILTRKLGSIFIFFGFFWASLICTVPNSLHKSAVQWHQKISKNFFTLANSLNFNLSMGNFCSNFLENFDSQILRLPDSPTPRLSDSLTLRLPDSLTRHKRIFFWKFWKNFANFWKNWTRWLADSLTPRLAIFCVPGNVPVLAQKLVI